MIALMRPVAGRVLPLVALITLLCNSSQSLPQELQKGKHSKGQERINEEYPEAVAEAEAGTPPSGLAGIYVLRPRAILGAAGSFGLTIDGLSWGLLNNGQYAWDPILPGNHSLGRAKINEFHLQVESGKTYYVEISAGGLASGGVRFLSADVGARMRRELRLSPDRWLLHQYVSNWTQVQIGMSIDEVRKFLRFTQMSTQIFSYRFANPSETSNIETKAGIPVVPIEQEVVFRSDLLWYVLIFRKNVLVEKRDGAVFPNSRAQTTIVDLRGYSGTVNGVPYVGGILNGDGAVPAMTVHGFALFYWDGTAVTPMGSRK